MFDGIQHIGYLVDDLEVGVAWFERAFGGVRTGGGTMTPSRVMPTGGINAFVRYGGCEVELMQPGDRSGLPKATLVAHHVGYICHDIPAAVARARAKGLRFIADAPYTNFVGQQVLYFDPDTTNGVWMHLTGVPAEPPLPAVTGPHLDRILHPGYLVSDAEAAAAWHVEKLGGVRVGGGPSRRGGRVAFVDCGAAQIELIEPESPPPASASPMLDHVGYVTSSLDADVTAYAARDFAFATETPAVNPIGQRLIYLDTATSMGARMHLTELPA